MDEVRACRNLKAVRGGKIQERSQLTKKKNRAMIEGGRSKSAPAIGARSDLEES